MLTTNERDKNHFVQKSDWHALTKMNGTKNELNLPLLRVDENIDGKKKLQPPRKVQASDSILSANNQTLSNGTLDLRIAQK